MEKQPGLGFRVTLACLSCNSIRISPCSSDNFTLSSLWTIFSINLYALGAPDWKVRRSLVGGSGAASGQLPALALSSAMRPRWSPRWSPGSATGRTDLMWSRTACPGSTLAISQTVRRTICSQRQLIPSSGAHSLLAIQEGIICIALGCMALWHILEMFCTGLGKTSSELSSHLNERGIRVLTGRI